MLAGQVIIGGEQNQVLFAQLRHSETGQRSVKVASITSIPGTVVSVKENIACPALFVVRIPVRPASGPLLTLKVTATPDRGLLLMSTTVAVTVCGVPV